MSSSTDYQELEALARKARWLAISTVAGSGAAEVLSELTSRRVIRFGMEDRWGESAPNDYLTYGNRHPLPNQAQHCF